MLNRKIRFIAVVLIFIILAMAGAGIMLAYTNNVPNTPSHVYVDPSTKALMVQKPQDIARPYLIRGTSWQPATKAPANGPNPQDPTQAIPYGFFFEWPGRYPQGHEAFSYWLRNEPKNHYLTDAALLQQMNVNTVRVYNDFGDEPQAYQDILDELYLNNIMVIMTVANGRDDLIEKFYVYYDQFSAWNNFIPSGWMGDYGDLTLDDAAGNPYSGQHCLKIVYSAKRSHGQGWAGIYWQNPENNWGTVADAGFNLTGATKLSFWARGEKGGEVIDTFKMGGISGQYPDSTVAAIGPITLTNTWNKYTIDLKGKNLSYIIGGFCWVANASRNPKGATFYLDEIRYEGYDMPGAFIFDENRNRYEPVISLCKDHPAILMWVIGNEWNFGKFFDTWSLDEAAEAVNFAAQRIKAVDSHHPVASILGDQFTTYSGSCSPPWVIKDVLQKCPQIDLWGINVYRGVSFTNLFDQWKQQWQALNLTAKSFFVSEFGIDSLNTSTYASVGSCPVKADNVTGYEDQQKQSNLALGLWDELTSHLSAEFPGQELCLGGLIHEFNDELWKVGNYHVGLGGLVDYNNPPDNHSYDDYNKEGFAVSGSSPDNVLNEEYFGLVNADRVPKQAYNDIKRIWLDVTSPLNPGPVTDDGAYTTSTTKLHAVWVPASDPETQVVEYKYKITEGSNIGPIIKDWASTGITSSVTSTGLTLVSGRTYYFSVKAKNEAGLWSQTTYSDGIIVDTSASSKPKVVDGGTLTSATCGHLGAWWSATDAQSGITEYKYRIKRDSPTGPTIKNWVSTATDNFVVVTKLNLINGKTYYFNVQARNGAGRWSDIGNSNGIKVDSALPPTPIVTDEGQATISTTQLSASWLFSCSASGIKGYRYKITQGLPTGQVIRNWASTGKSKSVTATGLNLEKGKVYYFTVQSKNNAGKWSAGGYSDGITVN